MTFFKTIIAFDNSLFLSINGFHTPFFDIFFQYVTWFGSGWIVTPILIGFVLKLTPRTFWKKTILCGIICISISGLLNSQIKNIVNRPRPIAYFSESNMQRTSPNISRTLPTTSVHVLGPHLRTRSFPSGHTNTAFAAATFLVLLYGGWFWCSFLIAIIVAYSRIYMGVHFFLDTVAGATLGIAIVLITYYLFRIKYGHSTGVCNDKQ